MKLFFKYSLVLLLLVVISPVVGAGNDIILNQDLEYINCNLQDVIRDLAEIGGYLVILDRQVLGEVSLTLKRGVTAKEAIGTVARGYGYSSRWLNASTLMVGTSAFINGNFATRSTRIYTLKHTDPILTAERLQTVIPRERIKINHKKKELTVTADFAEHQNVSELINRLDRPNISINLGIRVEELDDTLWKDLQLEMDWRSTELGAIILNDGQRKLLQESAGRHLLGESDLTCFNNQEARVLIGDYLPKTVDPNGGAANQNLLELESGTRLVLIPSIADGERLKLKIKASVKTAANNEQTVIRGIQSLIGVNIGEPFLYNGAMQRNEYIALKQKVTGYEYPILENIFEKRTAFDSDQSTRIIISITPKLLDGSAKIGDNTTADVPQNSAVEKSQTEVSSQSGNNNVSDKVETLTSDETEKPEVVFDAIVVPEGADKKLNVSAKTSRKEVGLYDVKYMVKKGDTSIGIARKYGVELKTILNRNKLSDSDVIKVGSIIIIPAPADRIYVVKPKETLWRIAKRYGLTIEVLMDLNGIDDQTKVNEGQTLILPMSNKNVVNPQF